MTRLIGQASKRSRPEVAPGSNPRQYHFRRHAAAGGNLSCRAPSIPHAYSADPIPKNLHVTLFCLVDTNMGWHQNPSRVSAVKHYPRHWAAQVGLARASLQGKQKCAVSMGTRYAPMRSIHTFVLLQYSLFSFSARSAERKFSIFAKNHDFSMIFAIIN